MSFPSQLKYIIISILLIAATVNFTRTTLDAINSSKRLEDLQNEVSTLEEKKDELQKQLDYSKTAHFIEKEARNKLNLILPGEEIFVLSPEEEAVLSATDEKNVSFQTVESKKNHELWLELFF